MRDSIVTQCPIPSMALDLTSLTYSASNVVEHALLLGCQALILEPLIASAFLLIIIDVISPACTRFSAMLPRLIKDFKGFHLLWSLVFV